MPIKTWNELPLLLNVEEVRKVLSGSGTISKAKVIEIMHSKGFPLFDEAKELKVYKGALEKWLLELRNK